MIPNGNLHPPADFIVTTQDWEREAGSKAQLLCFLIVWSQTSHLSSLSWKRGPISHPAGCLGDRNKLVYVMSLCRLQSSGQTHALAFFWEGASLWRAGSHRRTEGGLWALSVRGKSPPVHSSTGFPQRHCFSRTPPLGHLCLSQVRYSSPLRPPSHFHPGR